MKLIIIFTTSSFRKLKELELASMITSNDDIFGIDFKFAELLRWCL